MNALTIQDIIIKLLIATLFSAIIGYERERNKANAGLKTHMIVGVGATIIALIQQKIEVETFMLAQNFPDLLGTFRVDPSRLIAQVVSGIGFLGAGTIIVTKRNVTGLTTAASIWATASLGLAVGMDYLDVAIAGFAVIFMILFVIKKIQRYHYHETIIIQYFGGGETLESIKSIFESLGLVSKQIKHELKPFANERIYASTFEINASKTFEFGDLVSELAKMETIVSVQSTNLE